jgi:hypothetical protein
MTTKTFAYQLGEQRAVDFFDSAALQGIVRSVAVDMTAAQAAEGWYAGADPRCEEFMAGFRAAWQRLLDMPEFLWAAPKVPAVIATQPALYAALMKALPNVEQIGFHDQLATALIEHMTQATDRS